MSEDGKETAQLIIAHFKNLLTAGQAPEIIPEYADDEDFCATHNIFIALRELMVNFSRGNVGVPITQRGFVFGSIKALQANLEHMIWQIQQVANDDFTQRMTFMGEFAAAFNSMVINLTNARADLVAKQEALSRLIESLTEEINVRSSNLLALRESEEKFKYLAEHDALTGSLNRRSFLGRAEVEIQKAVFTGKSCALAMLDIDHFKRFNDTYGHSTGDAALKHMVATSEKSLRGSDFMGRQGGEEFVFFFADVTEGTAFVAAERIRKAIETTHLVFEGQTIPMTVSIGVCVVFPASVGERTREFANIVLNTADVALYQAKESGRNRCIVTILDEKSGAEAAAREQKEPKAPPAVEEKKGYSELGQGVGSAALVEALQVLDAVKKLQPVVAPELFKAPQLPQPAPQQSSTKAEEQEEDEFAYFKDYE
jgi:diguanylate cyclase (GGDEF)-like protein